MDKLKNFPILQIIMLLVYISVVSILTEYIINRPVHGVLQFLVVLILIGLSYLIFKLSIKPLFKQLLKFFEK